MDQYALGAAVAGLSLQPVDSNNWREVAKLEVTEAQRHFIATPTYYLSMCCFGGERWQPLALLRGEQVIGFLMWAVDPDDDSCWLGGIHIGREFQGRGNGRQLVQMALTMLRDTHGFQQFALAYNPTNFVAKRLYSDIGFVETGEQADGESVARL